MIKAKHRAELAHAHGAALYRLFVKIVAEQVDPVRAGKIVATIAVEIRQRHAARGFDETRGGQVGAYQTPVLERHAIGRSELQIRQRFRRLGSGPNRLGETGSVSLRKLIETGPTAGGDVVRRAVGTEKPLRVIFVEWHEAREPARDPHMAGKRGVFGLR